MAKALADDHPLSLLEQASMLLTVVDPRTDDPFARPGDAAPQLSRDELIASFVDVQERETTALLAVFAELTPDEVLAARIRRELSARDDRLPAWLVELGAAHVDRTVEMVHVLGDGDNVMLSVRVPPGHELTVVVYIDHNLGTVVKDAFVVPEPIDRLIDFMAEKASDPDTEWNDIDPAEARARITNAIEVDAMTVPRRRTDTWPGCRPLVEWVAGMLPSGGRGYVRPEWDDAALQDLANRFLDSPFAAGFGADEADLVDQLIWFATGYGPGDPLRWSPVAVELLLADWIPRKIVDDVPYLAKAPDVARAFIRYAHAERGIRPSLTEETLAAVDRFEPEYQRTIRSPRLQGPAALLAAAGMLDPEDAGVLASEPFDYRVEMLAALRRAVGSEEALDRLDDRPLPDEELSWDGIPEDIRGTVGEVLSFCDGCCGALLDDEYRTACRRFLSRVAAGDPNVFRRKARNESSAAAVCWAVGKANDLFSSPGRGMLVKDLLAHFGIKQGSVSQRATTLLRAGGFSTRSYWGMELGTPDLLVSSRRRTIMNRRDRFRQLLNEA